jgi:hypothetical protein
MKFTGEINLLRDVDIWSFLLIELVRTTLMMVPRGVMVSTFAP